MYISDLAEEFLLKDGEWIINPNSYNYENKIAEIVAKRQWGRESMAYAAGYVKALEEFTKVIHKYYEISLTEFRAGNIEYLNHVNFAEERIQFIQSIKVSKEL